MQITPSLRSEKQQSPVASEVAALTAVVRPILRGTLFALNTQAVNDYGGREQILLRQLARVYRQGDGDCGICFEYAVHDAVLRGESSIMERVHDGLLRCKITNGDPASILFGAEKNGAKQLIRTASDLLTDDSHCLSGSAGRPVKLKRHLQSISAAFRKADVRLALPSSIGGLWKADLFLGRPAADQWVGTTVKINQNHLEAARGLRLAVVPCRQGRTDTVRKDEQKNLIICPVPHDLDFMETFYSAWAIVQSFIAADAFLPKEVALPRAADRQVARYLAERREYPVLDVIEALGPLGQPSLLQTEESDDAIHKEGKVNTQTGAIVAPLPRIIR